MLSPHFGLGRPEMGASVTACGRAITKHMIEQIAEKISGEKAEVTWYFGDGKKNGEGEQFNSKRTSCFFPKSESISGITLLSDTDSCYFLTKQNNKEDAIKVADEIASFTNDTFPEFMRTSFSCSSSKYDSLIKAGREIVGRRGLFLNAKKKYTIRVIDVEGFSTFKLKMTGSELKKVDTPKVVQDFLKGLLEIILDGEDLGKEKTLEKYVSSARKTLVLKAENPIGLGAAKGINNYDSYHAAWVRAGKPASGKVQVEDGLKPIPGHVRAAIYYNEIATSFDGNNAKLLKSGDKARIFYLKPNEFGYKAIAIPLDLDDFPKWFNTIFQIDLKLTESKMIDSKIEGTYEALGWVLPTAATIMANKILKF